MVDKKKTSRRRLLVHLVVFGHALLLLAAATILAFRNGEVLGYFWDLPALLFLLVGLGLILSMGLFSLPTKSKIALLVVSSSLSLYAVEVGVRVLAPSLAPSEFRDELMAIRAQLAREAGRSFDTRSLLDVILDLRKQGTPALPSGNFETYLKENIVSEHWFAYRHPPGAVRRSVIRINGEEVLPLGQPAHQMGVGTDNENGVRVVFKTDEHGFRNPPGLWSLDEIDVVGVGDSFTEGCEVQDHESFMSCLRERFPRTINLGIGGGGPFTMLACLREYGQALKPKVVLWCFFEGNDLDNLVSRMHIPILGSYLQKDFRQNLLERQPELDEAIRAFLENAVQRQRELRLSRRSWRDAWNTVLSVITLEQICTKLSLRRDAALLNVATPDADWVGNIEAATGMQRLNDEQRALFSKVLAMAKSEVEFWGGKFVFVYLPAWERVADPRFKASVWFEGSKNQFPNDQRRQILAIVNSLNIDLIDTTLSFARHDDPLSLFPFRLPGHYNPQGHRFVAETIVEQLSFDSSTPIPTKR